MGVFLVRSKISLGQSAVIHIGAVIQRSFIFSGHSYWCQLLLKEMNPEIMEITDLALANILDVIPLISNTGEKVEPILLRIYERNAAVLDQN